MTLTEDQKQEFITKIIERLSAENDPKVDMLTGVLIGELRPYFNLERLKLAPEAVSEAVCRYSNAVLGIGVKMGIQSLMDLVKTVQVQESSAEKSCEKPGSVLQ